MFGRRRKRGRHHVSRDGAAVGHADAELGADDLAAASGPFDVSEAPEDGVGRLDLGSVRVPMIDGAQLQVEIDPEGPVRAVHLVTVFGQLTVNAYAAPRSGGLWVDVSTELAEQLRADGAVVRREDGEWGRELAATGNGTALRFVGVDGPRWLLRGVAAGPEQHAEQMTVVLRELLRGTVVVRGNNPLPVRTPLPLELPEPIARHIEQTRNGAIQG